MRILVTNDDGVGAPGLAALTRALVGWAEGAGADGPGSPHEILVVAPSSNYSGAGAAVGSVTDRTTIPYQRASVEGAEAVEAYGLDASPALSVIAGALGAVGPKPDLVVSGINHGVNVGRSVLHSGTVGAALTASQLGISALAVSLRVGEEPDPWESAADLAVALLPLLVAAPVRTVLNLNVPHLPLAEIRGVRWARVSGAGLIKSARGSGAWEAPNEEEIEGPAAPRGGPVGHGGRARGEGRDRAHRRLPVPPHGRPRTGRRRGRGRHPGGPGLRRPHRAAGPAGRGRRRAARPARPRAGRALAPFGFAG